MTKVYASLSEVGDFSRLNQIVDKVLDIGIDGFHLHIDPSPDGRIWPFCPDYTSKLIEYAISRTRNTEFDIQVHLPASHPHTLVSSYRHIRNISMTLPYASYDNNKGQLIECLDLIRRRSPSRRSGISLSAQDLAQFDPDLLHFSDHMIMHYSDSGDIISLGDGNSSEALRQLMEMKNSFNLQHGRSLELFVEHGISGLAVEKVKQVGVDGVILGKELFYTDNYVAVLSELTDITVEDT
jgi:pentose-5-phosphate-3-epimerase